MLDKINANCLQENHDRNDVGDVQADLVAASVDAEVLVSARAKHQATRST
jgi:hypothetical protein